MTRQPPRHALRWIAGSGWAALLAATLTASRVIRRRSSLPGATP